MTLMIEKVPVGPTRYRAVVLTSWDRGYLIAVVSRDVNVLTSWTAG